MAVPCATLEVEPWCEAQRDLNADPTSLGGATGGVLWAIGVRSCMRADDVANRSSAFISPHTVIDPVASAVEVGVSCASAIVWCGAACGFGNAIQAHELARVFGSYIIQRPWFIPGPPSS